MFTMHDSRLLRDTIRHQRTNQPCILDRRSDIAGALSIVLENAPYGPNVEEAKVRNISLW
jgi:hypothetical protein